MRDLLNAEDSYRCVYANVEGAQALREDVEVIRAAGLASRARLTLGDEFLGTVWSGILAEVEEAYVALGRGRSPWCC